MEKLNLVAVAVGSAIIGSVATLVFVRWKYRSDLKFLSIAHDMTEQGIRTLTRLVDEDDEE